MATLERHRWLFKEIVLAKVNISYYKLERIAYLALKNAIRLHLDSILLFKNYSYPSALQLSILCLEELGKAQEINHYYWTSKTNNGLMLPDDEEKYLKLYYSHYWKHGAAINRSFYDFSPSFKKLIDEKKLEQKKQKATYVGLPLINGKVVYNKRVLSPFMIKGPETKKLISLNNDILLEMCFYNIEQEGFFDVDGMDKLIDKKLQKKLKKIWPHRSGIKSRKWNKVWFDKLTKQLALKK